MRNHRFSELGGLIALTVALLALCAGANPAGAEVTPAADNSLTAEQYLAAGMPGIDKTWTPEDYQKADDTLQKIAATDVTQLPRFQSAKSGQVFAHLVSQKNLAFLTDKSIPVDQRMELAQKTAPYVTLLMIYADATKPNRAFDSETLELSGFILRFELATMMGFHDFVAAHPERKDNPQSMAGLKQMRDGIAQSTSGMVESLTQRDQVRASEAARFAAELKEYLPKLAPELAPEDLEKLKTQIQQAADKETDKDLKRAYEALLAAMK